VHGLRGLVADIYVDGTLGMGGHAAAILQRSAPQGRLLGLDRDSEALEHAQQALAPFGDRAELRHADYRRLPELLAGRRPDGILLDLGVSSLQLDAPERGFSFRAAARSTCAWTARRARRPETW
jgi:16S rRNA (cytosine1402-N4)-methyltransferase